MLTHKKFYSNLPLAYEQTQGNMKIRLCHKFLMLRHQNYDGDGEVIDINTYRMIKL